MPTSTPSRRVVALLLVAVLALAALPGVAAAEPRAGGTVVVEAGETVHGDLQAFGGTVVVRGTVDGDLQAVGGSVIVDGNVTGDVSAVGGSVTISGTVDGSVEAASGTVELTSSGVVHGDLKAGSGTVVLAGTVDGTARVGADTITVADSASIGGDLVYNGDLRQAPGATVGGTVREDPNLSVGVGPIVPRIPGYVGLAYGIAVTLLVGAVLVLVFPRFSRDLAARVASDPVRTGGIGLLALIAVPVALAIVAITIIGIPLALVGLLGYAIAVYLAYVYGQFALGAWLASLADVDNRWIALVVGVLAVFLVGYVPILGGLVKFAVLLLGLGAFAAMGYAWYRNRRNRGQTPTPADEGEDTTASAGSSPGESSA